MTEQEQIKSRAIAEFIGFKHLSHNDYLDENAVILKHKAVFTLSEFKFHTSLDWLWPVWVKFRNGVTLKDYDQCDEHAEYCRMVHEAFDKGTVLDIFNALYEGIEWYNSIKEAK